MLVYLESLTYRMRALSSSRVGSHPDFFYMFHSALEIILPTYTLPENPAQHGTSDDESTINPATREQSNENGPMPTAGANRCPMMNGSIQQTDFWQDLRQSDAFGEQRTENMPEFGHFDADPALLGNPFLSDSQEWSCIFSEWVNDFGMTP